MSSTRTSLDNSSRPPPTVRRNRAALREFYGLKNAGRDEAKISEESSRTETELGLEDDETPTELDASDFDAAAFVQSLLAKEGLTGVLRVEADLISRMQDTQVTASERASLPALADAHAEADICYRDPQP